MADGCSLPAATTFTLLALPAIGRTAARLAAALSAVNQSERATGSGLRPGKARSLPFPPPPSLSAGARRPAPARHAVRGLSLGML
eukprot:13099232-Alexandrium_andersonii.AAC.1